MTTNKKENYKRICHISKVLHILEEIKQYDDIGLVTEEPCIYSGKCIDDVSFIINNNLKMCITTIQKELEQKLAMESNDIVVRHCKY